MGCKIEPDEQHRTIVEQDEGDIDQPLICDWPNRPKQKVDSDGKPSLTHYQVIERNLTEHRTRVLLKPVTGRSHQLRVHMAYIGHPISGCEFYAHPAAKAMSNRLLLHASKLQFKHPLSGDDTAINSPANF